MTEKKINKEKKILITWANGFVWANLLRRLVSEWYNNIFVILRKDSNTRRIQDIIKKITISYVSLLDEQWLNEFIEKIKPDIIYHLAAAWAYIGRDGRWIKDLFEINVMGTINLINACQKVWFDYFINTGSNSEYGQKGEAMKETDMLEPDNEYWITKACASMYASYMGKKHSLPIYTFRLFAVYGYYEDKTRLIPSLMLNYIHDIAPELSKPDSIRPFLFIDDVVDHYLSIGKLSWDFGWIYNIGNNKQFSVAQVAEIVKNIAKSDKDPIYWAVPVRQTEPKNWIFDTKKSESVFWLQATPIEIGLQKTFEWFKKNNKFYI